MKKVNPRPAPGCRTDSAQDSSTTSSIAVSTGTSGGFLVPVAASSLITSLQAVAHASGSVAARTQRVVKNPRRLVFCVSTSRRKTGPPRTMTLNRAIVGRDNALPLSGGRPSAAYERFNGLLAGDGKRSFASGSWLGTFERTAMNRFRLPRFARADRYCSVHKADIFSPTAELISWLIETPSCSATSPR